jgi:hypothetical protein
MRFCFGLMNRPDARKRNKSIGLGPFARQARTARNAATPDGHDPDIS